MNGDPLARLRPLHLPDPVGWWPPAPLWWFLAAVALLALVSGARAALARVRRGAYRRAARRELAQALRLAQVSGDCAAFLAQASAILRRAALCRYPRATVASLHGDAWLRFLDESAAMSAFRTGAGRIFGSGTYRPEPSCDPDEVARICSEWLRRHR